MMAQVIINVLSGCPKVNKGFKWSNRWGWHFVFQILAGGWYSRCAVNGWKSAEFHFISFGSVSRKWKLKLTESWTSVGLVPTCTSPHLLSPCTLFVSDHRHAWSFKNVSPFPNAAHTVKVFILNGLSSVPSLHTHTFNFVTSSLSGECELCWFLYCTVWTPLLFIYVGELLVTVGLQEGIYQADLA